MDGEHGLRQLVDHHVASLERRKDNRAVRSVFPQRRHVHFLVEHHKLELHERPCQLGGVNIDNPLVVVVLIHRDGTLGLPRAERIVLADNRQALARAQLWRAHLQADTNRIADLRAQRLLVRGNTVGKRRAVEIRVFRRVNPMVVNRVVDALHAVELQPVGSHEPFMTLFHAVALHGIIVVNVRACLKLIAQVTHPAVIALCPHSVLRDFAVSIRLGSHQVQNQFLTKNCPVINIEM